MRTARAFRIGGCAAVILVMIAVFVLPFWNRRMLRDGMPYAVPDENPPSELMTNLPKLDIDTATRNDVLRVFGEPQAYMWGSVTYPADDLPELYVMVYSREFSIFMVGDLIQEYRFSGRSYLHNGRLTVGSPLADVILELGKPDRTVEKRKCGYTDGVLYRDIEGRAGFCYYGRADKNVRVFLTNYQVNGIYVTRSEKNPLSPPVGRRPAIKTDFIDYPFVPDPELQGKWTAVDFVESAEDFSPAMTFEPGDLLFHGLEFLEGGRIAGAPSRSWTKGFVIDREQRTASTCFIREIGGKRYLFYEWKNGDYLFRNAKPAFYVLEKSGP